MARQWWGGRFLPDDYHNRRRLAGRRHALPGDRANWPAGSSGPCTALNNLGGNLPLNPSSSKAMLMYMAITTHQQPLAAENCLNCP